MAGNRDHDLWRRRQRQRAVGLIIGLIIVLAASWATATIVVLILRRAWSAG
jgi:hypothetical protein